MFKTLKASKGFTLIELLVVIAIIAILAAVAAPMVLKQIEKSKLTNLTTSWSATKSATGLYYMDTGLFPTAAADLVVDSGATNWSGPYMEKEVTANKYGGTYSVIEVTSTAADQAPVSGTLDCALPGAAVGTKSSWLFTDGLSPTVIGNIDVQVDETANLIAGQFCSENGTDGYFYLGDNR